MCHGHYIVGEDEDGKVNSNSTNQTPHRTRGHSTKQPNNDHDLLILQKPSEKSPLDLRKVHEHYEVSSGIAGILKRAVDQTNASAKSILEEEPSESQDAGGDVGVSIVINGKRTQKDRSRSKSTESQSESDSQSPLKTSKYALKSSLKRPRPRSNPREKISAEEMERRNQVRKLNYWLKDQEKVVQVDEKALVRAAVSKQKQKRNSRGSEVRNSGGGNRGGSGSLDGTPNSNLDSEDGNVDGNSRKKQKADDPFKSSEKTVTVMANGKNGDKSGEDENDEDKNNLSDDDDETKMESTQHILDRAMNAIVTSDQVLSEMPESQSLVFFSAPEDSLNANVNANANAINASVPKAILPTVHDAPVSTQELMDDAREKEAADRSGEWMEQEVEIEEEERKRRQSMTAQVANADTKGTTGGNDCPLLSSKEEKSKEGSLPMSAPNPALARDLSQISMSDKFFSAASEQGCSQEVRLSEGKKMKEHFPKGTVVQVENRTWPGVNKPGGVARVSKVHMDSAAGIKYDVTYILGGREKMVDSAFVREHKDLNGSFLPPHGPESKKRTFNENGKESTTCVQPRKSRRVGERKQVEEWIAQIDAEEEIKLKSEEKSIHTVKTAHKPKRRSSRAKTEDQEVVEVSANNEIDSCQNPSRRTATKEAKPKNSDKPRPALKKRKAKTALESEPTKLETNYVSPDSKKVYQSSDSMTFREIMDCATSLYSTMISKLSSKRRKNTTTKTVFVTCSNLSEHEKSIVQEVILNLSNDEGMSSHLHSLYQSSVGTFISNSYPFHP